jgi:hypothetical protein
VRVNNAARARARRAKHPPRPNAGLFTPPSSHPHAHNTTGTLLELLVPRDEARALVRVGRAFTSGGEPQPPLPAPPPGDLFSAPADTVKGLFRERTAVLRSLLAALEEEGASLESALCGGGAGGGAEVEVGAFTGGGEGGGQAGGALAAAAAGGGGGGEDPSLGRTLGVSPLLAKQSQLYLCFRTAAARLSAKKEALRGAAAGDEGAAQAAEDAAAAARARGASSVDGDRRALALASPAALNAVARRLRAGRRDAAAAAEAASGRAAATAAVLSRICALREEDAARSREAVRSLTRALEVVVRARARARAQPGSVPPRAPTHTH